MLSVVSCVGPTRTDQTGSVTRSQRLVPFGTEYSLVVDDLPYGLVLDTNRFIFVVTGSDTSLLFNSEAVDPQGIEILDLNGDGRLDVKVNLFSNTPGEERVFLFDTISVGFKRLRNALYYAGSRPLPGTPYCISYNRAGCADYNWESWLFGMMGDSAYSMGHMIAECCPGAVHPKVVIYRAMAEQHEWRMDSLPADTTIEFVCGKRDLLEGYWRENFKRFEQPAND